MSHTCNFHTKPLIIFELNEFNEDLLETAAKQHELKNILALLNYPKTKISPQSLLGTPYKTSAACWESLHTGVAPSIHDITRPGIQYGQYRPVAYWDHLLAQQYTVGLWGVMNAHNPEKIQNKFFLPDLWQSTEPPYPKSLTHFIELPRYLNKNHPNFSPDLLIKHIINFIKFMKNSGLGKKISLEIIRLLFQLIRSPNRSLLFICFYDLISCMLFSDQLKKNPVQLSLFFANSIAYLQKYYWQQGKWIATAPMLHGLKILDRMVGLLREFEQTHHIIFINGLTQENTQNKPEQVAYAIKNPFQFFQYMALTPTNVMPLSSQEGMVYFDTPTLCKQACDILNHSCLDDELIFTATAEKNNATALHYKIIFNSAIIKTDFFILNGSEFRFLKYFKPINTLTGNHGTQGVIYSQGVDFPKEITPEAFNKYIIQYYTLNNLSPTPVINQVEYA